MSSPDTFDSNAKDKLSLLFPYVRLWMWHRY